jgi:hypothetical protein
MRLFVVACLVACGHAPVVARVDVQAPSTATPEPPKVPTSVVMTFELEQRGKVATVVWELKGNKARFETPGDTTSYVILDYDSQQIFAVFVEAKTIAVGAIPKSKEDSQEGRERTGRWERVAGERCEVMLVHQPDGGSAEACVTKLPYRAPLLDVTGVAGFPVRVTVRDASGKITSRLALQKIDERAVDDSRFVPPADYERREK